MDPLVTSLKEEIGDSSINFARKSNFLQLRIHDLKEAILTLENTKFRLM